ncbi:hypothetical protein EDD11_003868 [Mortierella claussenii]|nr:hypothetical protein EDD11_003868 [Mortierella claussenii]
MTYHKSEYTMWANATLRQDKVFGSTDPIGVVEIKFISRDSNLRWTRCKIIHNDYSKPPFDISAVSHQCTDGGHVPQLSQASPNSQPRVSMPPDIELVRSTPSQDISGMHASEEEDLSQIMEEDSIDGLHADMNLMGVLHSSQGSVLEGSLGDYMKSQQRFSRHADSNLTTIREEAHSSAHTLQFLKSSQGSDDGSDGEDDMFIKRSDFTLQKATAFDGTLDPSNGRASTSHLFSSSNIGDQKSGEEQEVVVPDEDCTPRRTASAMSSIDGRSLDREASHSNISTQDDAVAPSLDPQTETSTPTMIDIIFSNLFNWSALKVTDRVEIHEPCRKIEMTERGSEAQDSTVWIVERYKVVST